MDRNRTVTQLSVDGAHGVDGAPGQRGADAVILGTHGYPGTPAGRATAGRPGGTLQIELSAPVVRCRLNQTPHEFALHPTADIAPSARGGKGGDGGRGGDGGNGAPGVPGTDATRYQSGGDGGPGGNGGPGAPGTDGADGAPGGHITVRVHERESYLLMAVRGSDAPYDRVAGGAFGRRGEHGRGGKGGPGGRGGSSYSWTTDETYTDSQGNTRHRTNHHSNPGGSSGRNGLPGATPTTPLEHGRVGASGTFQIELVSDDPARGTLVYPRRYDLALDSFEFAEASGPDRDGILEFGEIVEVTRLVVGNRGIMPTPAHQRIRITLQAHTWCEPCGDELFIDRSLAPNESITLEGVLRFRIPRPVIDAPADPRVETGSIAPRADQLGPERADVPAARTPFQRRYEQFNLSRTFEARFPVENATEVRVLRSIAPGEQSRFVFQVDNISRYPIGRKSPRKRRLQVQLEYVRGDVGIHELLYVDQDGVEHRLEDTDRPDSGYVHEIHYLEADRRYTIEGRIGFCGRVAPYSGATVRATIWLESLAHNGHLEVVQCREVTLRAEPGYVATPDARVLLLTHDTTTRELYNAYNALLDDHLGLPADDWSLSRYGHFDHEAILPDGRPLQAHLAEKLVVVINDPFHPRSESATELPTDYVRGGDFRESSTTGATRYLIIGSSDFALRQWLEPTSPLRSGGGDFATTRRFIQSVERSAGTLTEELFGDDITTYYDRVEVVRTAWPFTRPSRLRLMKIAARLAKRLRRIHPHRRYVIVYRDPPEGPRRAGRSLGLLPRWQLGELEVRRSLNLEVNNAVTLRIEGDALSRPDVAELVNSEDHRFALLLALRFDAKLDLLNAILQREGELDPQRLDTAQLLVRAMLVDLAEEQAALRSATGSFDDAMIEERLSHLVRLRDCPLSTGLTADSNKWEVLFALSAGLEALARSQRAWWALWGKQKRCTDFTLRALEKFNYETYSRFVIDTEGDVAMGMERARAAIAPKVEALLSQLRKGLSWFARWIAHGRARRHALVRFQHPPPIGRTVFREIDSWRDALERVWSEERFAEACAAENERRTRQAELRALNASDRSEMLVLPAAVSAVPSTAEAETEAEAEAPSR